MAVKYTYSIQNDFPNEKVASDRLSKEIQDYDTTATLSYISTDSDSDSCDIWFNGSLTSGEETGLNSIISNHSGELLLSEFEAIAGEDLGVPKGVYISDSDEVKLAHASSETTLPCVGFTTHAASNGEKVVIQSNDILGGFSNLTPSAKYFLPQDSTAAGEITTTKPSSGIIVRVGVAKNSSQMDIHILRLTREGVGEDIHISTGGDILPYTRTTATTWKLIRSFVFRGTNKLGVLKACKYIVIVLPNSTGYYQLYDVTNDNIISEVSVTSPPPGPVLLTDTTLENLPTGEAIFELFMKSSSVTKEVRIHHLLLEF